MSVQHGALTAERHGQPSARVRRSRWILRLFVAGKTPRSATALTNLTLICDEQLKSNYRIEVIDLLKSPRLAHDNQIVAVPTLVRKVPRPVRNIIGDLSDTPSVLAGLDLTEHRAPERREKSAAADAEGSPNGEQARLVRESNNACVTRYRL